MTTRTKRLKQSILDSLTPRNIAGEIVGLGIDAAQSGGQPLVFVGNALTRHATSQIQSQVRKKLKRTFFPESVSTLAGSTTTRFMVSKKGSKKRSSRRTKKSSKKKTPRRTKVIRKRPKIQKVPYPSTVLAQLVSYHEYTMDPGTAGGNRPAIMEITPNVPNQPIVDGNSTNISKVHELLPQWWAEYIKVYNHYEPLSAKVQVEFMASAATVNTNYGMLTSSTSGSRDDVDVLKLNSGTTLIKTRYASTGRLKMLTQVNSGGGQNANHIIMSHDINFKKAEGFKKSVGDGTLFVGETDVQDQGDNTVIDVPPSIRPPLYVFIAPLDALDVGIVRVILKITTMVRFSERVLPKASGVA